MVELCVVSCVLPLPFVQPNFGASLHICKVEIGGDAQSTGDCGCGCSWCLWKVMALLLSSGA